jgi:preprotein translocase subunit SecA
MEYEDARDFLFDIYRESFERDRRPMLDKLKAQLTIDADRPIREGQAEIRTRSLLETIDNNFQLSPTSAGRFVEAEIGSGSMAAGAAEGVVEELQEQLESLYHEVEQTLGDVFVETTAHMPLIALVDNRLPRSVYRQIEEQLGAEGIEEVENVPVGQLPRDVQGIVKDAFVRWQESDLMLRVIDHLWTRHLTTMEGLRHSIGLQAYGQKDPLVQYKVKAYELFDELKAEIRQLVVLNVLLLGARAESARPRQQAPQPQAAAPQPARAGASTGDGRSGGNGRNGRQQQQQRGQAAPAAVGAGKAAKIGRNDPCFCGSGKKYKHCHGR